MDIADIHVSYPRVTNLRLSELPLHLGDGDGGQLTVVEGKDQVPFRIERIFTLRAPLDTIRGGHAHRRCSQFMMCPHGMIEVICEDGIERKSFLLDRGNVALLVPPSVWASEIFRHDNSLLLVVCDRPYEAEDYIRDHAEFLAWRRVNKATSAGIVTP